ncbi:hypothetical protein BS50DRAFT_107388 [Corynespora cassiicola Philippines]|uniref:Uncharacterized protein n=1 Tax=Corynespora cassiicola Philippines TaxID=1448308 RepID=A0A2T2NCR8_CORCC|nr:hypothetical protein BS50DRAFT_107388 [Corynespora cassiicola Philippines]
MANNGNTLVGGTSFSIQRRTLGAVPHASRLPETPQQGDRKKKTDDIPSTTVTPELCPLTPQKKRKPISDAPHPTPALLRSISDQVRKPAPASESGRSNGLGGWEKYLEGEIELCLYAGCARTRRQMQVIDRDAWIAAVGLAFAFAFVFFCGC